MDPRRQSITRSHRKSNRRHPRQTASTSRAAHRARQPHRLHGLENRASASLNQPHPTPVSSLSVCLPAGTVRPAHSPALDPRPRPDPIARPWRPGRPDHPPTAAPHRRTREDDLARGHWTSRTSCTGSATSPSTRTTTAPAPAAPLRSWPASAT